MIASNHSRFHLLVPQVQRQHCQLLPYYMEFYGFLFQLQLARFFVHRVYDRSA